MIMLVYKVSIQILVEKCSPSILKISRVFEIFYTMIADSRVHFINTRGNSTMLKISMHLYLYYECTEMVFCYKISSAFLLFSLNALILRSTLLSLPVVHQPRVTHSRPRWRTLRLPLPSPSWAQEQNFWVIGLRWRF